MMYAKSNQPLTKVRNEVTPRIDQTGNEIIISSYYRF